MKQKTLFKKMTPKTEKEKEKENKVGKKESQTFRPGRS
jgi:hypothetical protein